MSKQNARKPLTIVLVVVIVACLVGAAFGIRYLINYSNQLHDASDTGKPPQTEVADGDVNPIDFSALRQANPDVCAWVYVPDTGVNYPVVQRTEDDDFYLAHNVAGEASPLGAIFIQGLNSADFTDYATILYGHMGDDDTMFGGLHKYEDAAFFKEHGQFYVYTPSKAYTYRVVSAFIATDEHFMHKYGFFAAASSRSDFAAEVLSKNNAKAQVSESFSVKDVAQAQGVVILSTCNAKGLGGRYVVCGVMSSVADTK